MASVQRGFLEGCGRGLFHLDVSACESVPEQVTVLCAFAYGQETGVDAPESRQHAIVSNPRQRNEGPCGLSTDRFVRSGIVPGLVLIGMLSIYVMIVAIKNKVPRQKFDLAELGRAFVVALPEIVIPFLVIIGLVKGLLLPQLASMCVLYVLLIESVVYRDLKLAKFWKVIGAAMALAGAIFAIILCAQAFTNLLVTAEVPQKIVVFISEHFDAKWSFLLALNVMLLIVGMVMDIFSAIVVVVPLIAPAAIKMGVDPFHLGVIFLLNLEVGYLHPPVGLNLFITSFTFKKPILEVTIAAVPYLLIMIVALGVITYVPSLTVVPPEERRGRVSEMQRQVHNAFQELSAVQELALPDGKSMKLADCEKMTDATQKEECVGLFLDVTECRKTAAGKADGECEKKAIADYLAAIKEAADVEDWDTEEADAGPGEDEEAEPEEGKEPE